MSFMMDLMDSIWVPVVTLNVLALGGVVAVALGTANANRGEEWKRTQSSSYSSPAPSSSSELAADHGKSTVVSSWGTSDLRAAIERGKILGEALRSMNSASNPGPFNEIVEKLSDKIDALAKAYSAHDAPAAPGVLSLDPEGSFVFESAAGPLVLVRLSLSLNGADKSINVDIKVEGWTEGFSMPPELRKSIPMKVFEWGIENFAFNAYKSVTKLSPIQASYEMISIYDAMNKIGLLGAISKLTILNLEDELSYILFVDTKTDIIKTVENKVDAASTTYQIALDEQNDNEELFKTLKIRFDKITEELDDNASSVISRNSNNGSENRLDLLPSPPPNPLIRSTLPPPLPSFGQPAPPPVGVPPPASSMSSTLPPPANRYPLIGGGSGLSDSELLRSDLMSHRNSLQYNIDALEHKNDNTVLFSMKNAENDLNKAKNELARLNKMKKPTDPERLQKATEEIEIAKQKLDKLKKKSTSKSSLTRSQLNKFRGLIVEVDSVIQEIDSIDESTKRRIEYKKRLDNAVLDRNNLVKGEIESCIDYVQGLLDSDTAEIPYLSKCVHAVVNGSSKLYAIKTGDDAGISLLPKQIVSAAKSTYNGSKSGTQTNKNQVKTRQVNSPVESFKKSVVEYFNSLDQTIDINRDKPSSIHIDNDATVYVVGDLEGHGPLLMNLLINLHIIKIENENIKWIAADNVYVVQCGDQIDQGTRWSGKNTKNDLQTLLLTSYLQYISNGMFVNIIGNHEWMNVIDKTPQSRNDTIQVCVMGQFKNCSFPDSFSYNGLFGKILRQRYVVYNINDVIFSHAGITAGLIQSNAILLSNKQSIFDILNSFNTDSNNFKVDGERTDVYKLVYGIGDEDKNKSVLWNRVYNLSDATNIRPDAIIPPQLTGIKLQVVGHNKPLTNEKCHGMWLGSSDSDTKYIQANGSSKFDDDSKKYVLMSDALCNHNNNSVSDKEILLYYAQLSMKNKSVTEVHVHGFKCDVLCITYDQIFDSVLRTFNLAEQKLNIYTQP